MLSWRGTFQGEVPREIRCGRERKFKQLRLRGSDPVQVDVRIIAATNVDLTEKVRAGQFRSDLFYR